MRRSPEGVQIIFRVDLVPYVTAYLTAWYDNIFIRM